MKLFQSPLSWLQLIKNLSFLDWLSDAGMKLLCVCGKGFIPSVVSFPTYKSSIKKISFLANIFLWSSFSNISRDRLHIPVCILWMVQRMQATVWSSVDSSILSVLIGLLVTLNIYEKVGLLPFKCPFIWKNKYFTHKYFCLWIEHV